MTTTERVAINAVQLRTYTTLELVAMRHRSRGRVLVDHGTRIRIDDEIHARENQPRIRDI